MKVLCVQCLKLNDLQDSVTPGQDGKVRFPCPHCGFVTVVTRKAARSVAKPVAAKPVVTVDDDDDPTDEASVNRNNAGRAQTAGTLPSRSNRPPQRDPALNKSLHDELFDGSEKEVGDWMVRRLDGTEAGPLTFEALAEMIREGDIGKIDEVRRLDERYVPAAFHELTAELFNELDMAPIGPSRKG